jgi:hypothetical protein
MRFERFVFGRTEPIYVMKGLADSCSASSAVSQTVSVCVQKHGGRAHRLCIYTTDVAVMTQSFIQEKHDLNSNRILPANQRFYTLS